MPQLRRTCALSLLITSSLLFASSSYALTLTTPSKVTNVRLGATSNPFMVGQTVEFTIRVDEAVTANPANDADASTSSTLFYGAFGLEVQFDTIAFHAVGEPDGVSGPVLGNTSVVTRDPSGIDSQVGIIGRRGATGEDAGGTLSLLQDPGLGDLTFIGMSLEVLGAGIFNGLSPNPDPAEAILALYSNLDGANLKEVRLHFEDANNLTAARFVSIVVPEPTTAALLTLGLVGLAAGRRRPRA
jgi:hypothetical protein